MRLMQVAEGRWAGTALGLAVGSLPFAALAVVIGAVVVRLTWLAVVWLWVAL